MSNYQNYLASGFYCDPITDGLNFRNSAHVCEHSEIY